MWLMVSDWVIVDLEPAGAARSGLPPRLVVPREVAERTEPLERARVVSLARAFLAGTPDHDLAPVLHSLVEAEPYRQLGERLLREGRAEDAVVALARAAEQTPFAAATRHNLAVALLRAGDGETALQVLEEIVWAYENESGFHAMLGRLYEEVGEPERAVQAYERSLVLAPGDEPVLLRLERLGALVRLDGPDGEPYWLSPADFERVMRQQLAGAAEDPAALVQLGVMLLGRSQPALAATAGELATAAGGDTHDVWLLIGRAYSALGRHEHAREALEHALVHDPDSVFVARALVERADDPAGDLVRAQVEVQRRPELAAGWLVLGDALVIAERPDEALGAYVRALELDPKLEGADHAREALRMLGA